MPTSTVENYLKALYTLTEAQDSGDAVSLGDLARHLDLVPGTVTSMIKRLSRETDLIDYRPHKGAALSEEGRRSALKILRRHRIIELFLVEIVSMDGPQVHEEAENLEHAMSDDLVNRLSQLLGEPTHDPHGAPIPTEAGEMPEDPRISLAQAQPGSYIIVGLDQQDPAFQQFAEERGLRLIETLGVLENNPLADTVTLQVGNSRNVFIGGKAAEKIIVRGTSGS